mmetsp:Transcript_25751/g.59899  ORF Transcript_25751/g.59899 Transcript_25751/m.59899 type:complete len:210 (+) Transcript_25751:198-827(+)
MRKSGPALYKLNCCHPAWAPRDSRALPSNSDCCHQAGCSRGSAGACWSPAYAATASDASWPCAAVSLMSFMSSWPLTFSWSSSFCASASRRGMLEVSKRMPRWYCSSTTRLTSASTFCLRLCDTGGAPPPMKSRPMKGPPPPPPCCWPMTRWPTTSDMPSCVTMAWATCVHCWKSLEAPVVTLSLPLMISSARRPPRATHMRFSRNSLE